MTTKQKLSRFIGQAMIALLFIAGVTVLLLWLSGTFAPKVSSSRAGHRSAKETPRGEVVAVRTIQVPRVDAAVGTIRAVHETTIGSKLMARVTMVNLKAGQQVRNGDILVQLDDADLTARLEQSRAAVTSAEAAFQQATADEARSAGLLKQNAVSRQEYERTSTAKRSTEAELRRAREVVKEAQATVEWATVRSPIDGAVIDKKVDVGDLVRPGQMLVTLYDPRRMQLVASVRESLAQRLSIGQEIGVEIEGLNKHCVGEISEIVPEAQAASRAFQVKVTGPCPSGIYTGMFARLLIPLDDEEVLVVPLAAIHRVGQLELVDVLQGELAQRRAVRTGRVFDQNVEVLSGLTSGEQIIISGAGEQRKEAGHE
jgi:RND family efflux transporter MFP subunit